MTPDEALRKLLMGYERRIKALEEWKAEMDRIVVPTDALVERVVENVRPKKPKGAA